MKDNRILKVLLAITIIVLGTDLGARFHAGVAQAVDPKTVRYEYKIIDVNVTKSTLDEFEALLNRMGREGWQYDHSIMYRYKVFRRRF